MKKVKGRQYYFSGSAAEALKEFNRIKAALHAGVDPRKAQPIEPDELTVRRALNAFLTDRDNVRQSGELSERSFRDYQATCKRIVNEFGPSRRVVNLTAMDFSKLHATLSKGKSPTTVRNEIVRVKVAFNYAYKAGLVEHPVRFGPSFKAPSPKVIRLHRESKGERMFSRQEILDLLDIASVQMRAMILLAVNCGLGNSDVSGLRVRHIDLKGGWLKYPRPKTGVSRMGKLWPETVAALEAALAERNGTTTNGDRVFLTRFGKPWVCPNGADNAVTKEFRKLLGSLGIYREGLSFYTLRHVFATIAGGTKDQVAVDVCMGHAISGMAQQYRERIDDDRFEAVADHVHEWLWS